MMKLLKLLMKGFLAKKSVNILSSLLMVLVTKQKLLLNKKIIMRNAKHVIILTRTKTSCTLTRGLTI